MTTTKAKPTKSKAAKSHLAAEPRLQIDSFLRKYTPQMEKLGRAALAKMRKRLPHAIEMVYDNYNALAFGFCPNDRPRDAIFSIVLYARHAALFFLQGARLPDPHKRLQGSGNVVRHVRFDDVKILDDPQILELMERALQCARVPMNPQQKRELVIRAVAAKQRSRRPGKR